MPGWRAASRRPISAIALVVVVGAKIFGTALSTFFVNLGTNL